MKRQKIVHSYGDDWLEEGDLEEELEHRVSTNTVPQRFPAMQDTMPGDVDFAIGSKHCKCGSSTHQQTSHHDCPLRSAKKVHHATQANTPIVVQPGVGKRCKCGASSHQCTSHRDCPLRKPQISPS